MSRRRSPPRSLQRATGIADLRLMARRRLPGFAFEYLDGGAEDEVTLQRNRTVFDTIALTPRALRDVSAVDLGTSIFGTPVRAPFAIAPTGFNGLYRHHGDLALARAAAAAGIGLAQSTVSNAAIEAVAACRPAFHWFQLYALRGAEVSDALLRRAQEAGCEALVFTVDGPVVGNREWDRRNWLAPGRLDLRSRLDVLARPGWLRDVWRHGLPAFENLAPFVPGGGGGPIAAQRWLQGQQDASLDWSTIAALRERWPRPIVLKGIMSVDDARRAADAGVDGIILSNHGGRQLDSAPSPMTVLPEVAAAVGSRLTVMIDSGFRRGSDIAKALMLGASLVFVGRAPLYGLAAAGEPGVAAALETLRTELSRVMALVGAPTVEALRADGRDSREG